MTFKRFFFILLLLSMLWVSYGKHIDSLTVQNIEFISNKGQWDEKVLFKAKLNGGALFAEKQALTFCFLDSKQLQAFNNAKQNRNLTHNGLIDASCYKVNFIASNPEVNVSGNDKILYHHNYFIGNDPSKWQSEVPLYRTIQYSELYDGIDLFYYETNHQLKYEFVVKPYASPRQIELQYEGVKSLSLSKGNLLVSLSTGSIIELKPYSYQIDAKGDTVFVECNYELSHNQIKYWVGTYDSSLPLIIDPTIIFSSYTGSTADNWGYTATFDFNGNLYGGGISFNIGYPTTTGSYQINYGGGSCDVAISKFDALGSYLHYSTYLGGNYSDIPQSLFVNDNNELYVFGTTGSNNFPTSQTAFDRSFNGGSSAVITSIVQFPNGSDLYVAKFSTTGSQLLASTYIGGSGNDGLNLSSMLKRNYADEARGEIIIDNNSNVYVVCSTFSTDFPTTQGAFQQQSRGNQDACIVKMNHNLSNIIWASYFGGSDDDSGYSIVLSSNNDVYFCGGTTSTNLSTSPNALQLTKSADDEPDGYIAHISENGTQILNCTYYGHLNYDQSYLIKNDRNDYPHVFGQNTSTGTEWITNAGWNTPGGGQYISKLTPTLDSIVWSTAYGARIGEPDISPTALLVDYCSNIYMSGWGSLVTNGFGGTSGLPITIDAFQSTTDNNDYYFICMSDDASSLVYASYFGSPNSNEHVDGGTSRFDKRGRIYQAVCAGCGGDHYFPTTPGAWSGINGSSNCNLGVIKLDFNLPVVTANFNIPPTVCAPIDLLFPNQSQAVSSNTSYYWNFGDGTTSTVHTPTHTYTQSGIYTITLVVTDLGSCNFSDTLRRQLLVLANSCDTLSTLNICDGEAIQIGFPPNADDMISYTWTPLIWISNPFISNPMVNPLADTIFTLIITDGNCTDTLLQEVNIIDIDFNIMHDTTICLGEAITITTENYNNQVIDTYEWATDINFSTLLNTSLSQNYLEVSPQQTTTYYLRITSEGCTKIYSTQISVSVPTIHVPESITICFENSANIIAIHSDDSPYTYQWTPTESIISGADSNIVCVAPSENTTYTVIATNAHGCTITADVLVMKRKNTFLYPLDAGANRYLILQGDTTCLFVRDFGNDYHYQWMPTEEVESPTSYHTKVRVFENTPYIIFVTDSFGCVKTDTVFIEVKEFVCGFPLVYVPNAFSPNGDHQNDIFYVRSDISEQVKLMIYNRWGEKVFETQEISIGWDGTYKGKPCEAGVYDYYLECICFNKEIFIKKGNITLLR